MYCQVVYICGLIPARIRHALAELPETLDETYQRTLREINKAEWEFAHRLFQFVAVASRPLRVEELADLLAFDFDAGPIPKFHEGWRLEDPVDAVLSTCSSLLAVVDGGRFGKVIQFSHFSVREFLTSARLAEASDIIPRQYHISTTRAHTLAAQACLGILLHLDEDVVTGDSPKDSPFADYAAEHWADHARLEDVSGNVEDGMKRLFDPSKPHLAVCIWIHNPDIPPWRQIPRAGRLLTPGRSPLHYAVLWGLNSMVEFLATEHPQDVYSRSLPDSVTPLHLASKKGHVKVARFLLERDADVTAKNTDMETPLHLASQEGHVEVASMLIERGADVTAQNKDGETPLHLASNWGHVEVAGMLIERGADVTVQNKVGSTPLHLASQRGQVEVAGMLIERGADVTAQDKEGKTPLLLASRAEIASVLIERGADLTAQDKYGETSLYLALRGRQLKVAGVLMERGADVTVRNGDGSTPLHQASYSGDVGIAGMLIECGADVEAQDKNGWTPLHLASQQGELEVANMLIERGANVATQNEFGLTALHLASQQGQLEVASMLIEHGANVTALTKDNSTSLHLAATLSHYSRMPPQQYAEVARLLLGHGADITVRDKDGRTPFDLASSSWGLEEVAHVLHQHRADSGTHERT